MTATLDGVTKNKAEPTAEQAAALELVRVAREQGLSLTGPGGLLKQLTKAVIETSLNEEMTEHLGYEKHDPAGAGTGNIRNGTRAKTVLTDASGPVEIDVPRDRAGTFEPQIVRKRQRRLSGVDEVVLSLYAKGLTTGEISAHFAEIYGASVSKETISRITDKVLEQMQEWVARPLESTYAAIFIDAIVVKVRDGQVANRPFYAAIGVTLAGERDILGLWAGTGGEGAKFWMAVLTDLKNRGVNDTFFVVCDGLKGLPEVVSNVWPQALIQTCIIHLIRNTFRLTSRRYWDEIKRDLKPIYTAVNATAARVAFDELAEKWGQRYPAVIRLWDNAWSEFIPFLDYGGCCRMRVVDWVPRPVLGQWFMAKSYRPVLRDQTFLMPPDMREWLPADHLVWFMLDTIEVLDTSDFGRCRRRGGVGAAGYDPRMLLGLLVYAYCRGIRSSRQIERLCSVDVAFRVLCAQDVPDHCTIARFRVECQDAFARLFTQVLMIAGRAGLGHLGTVAIDGTKIAANASIDANRGHDWLSEQVNGMILDAERTDASEDNDPKRAASRDDSDRVPAALGKRSERAKRIRAAAEQVAAQLTREQQQDSDRASAAQARLAKSEAGEPMVGRIPDGPHRLAEARAHLAREIANHQARLDRRAAILASGKKPMGAPPVSMDQHSRIIRARNVVAAALAAEQAEAAKPAASALPKTVANITDPHSRLMPTRKGFLQGYNAQFAITADQIIIATGLGQNTNDQSSFVPMMHAAVRASAALHAETGRPRHILGVVLADAGYCSDRNLAAPGPERLIALTKARDHAQVVKQQPVTGEPPPGATPREAMSHRLRTPEGAHLYRRRGATVEPGIGNLKKILDRFSLRGVDGALSELNLAAAAFNLMKIYRAQVS